METKTIRINSNQFHDPFKPNNIYKTTETSVKVRGTWSYLGKIYYRNDVASGIEKVFRTTAEELHQNMKLKMKEIVARKVTNY